MYRAAVDATVAYALDSLDSGVDLGGQEPTRFLSALAGDLGVPEEKAVATVCSAVAAATRSRLISVSTRSPSCRQMWGRWVQLQAARVPPPAHPWLFTAKWAVPLLAS
jgi:hypothetical protein